MKSNLCFLVVLAFFMVLVSCGNDNLHSQNSYSSGNGELPDSIGDKIVDSVLDSCFGQVSPEMRYDFRKEFFITKFYLAETLSRRKDGIHEKSIIIFKGVLKDTTYTGRIICYPDSIQLPEDAIIFNKEANKLHVCFHEKQMKSVLSMMEDQRRIVCRYVRYPDTTDYASFHYYREPWEGK